MKHTYYTAVGHFQRKTNSRGQSYPVVVINQRAYCLDMQEERDLQGHHRAVLELHAEKLEKISKKFQAGIGYDYDKAVAKCRKIREKQSRNDDVGGEAMMMAYIKAKRAVGKQEPPVGKESGAET